MKYSIIFAAAACLVQAAPVTKEGGLPTPQQYGRAATYHLPKRDALATPDSHELYTGEHFKRAADESPEPEMVYRDVYFAGGFAKRDAGEPTPEVYGKGTPNFGKREAEEKNDESPEPEMVYRDVYYAGGFAKRDAGEPTPEAYPHPGLNKKDETPEPEMVYRDVYYAGGFAKRDAGVPTPEAYPHPGLN